MWHGEYLDGHYMATNNFTTCVSRVLCRTVGLITLGPLSIVWALWDERFAEMQGVILGIYAIAIGVLMWGYEYFKGYDRPGTNSISYKGIAYLVYVYIIVLVL